jgi:hypothetical protein
VKLLIVAIMAIVFPWFCSPKKNVLFLRRAVREPEGAPPCGKSEWKARGRRMRSELMRAFITSSIVTALSVVAIGAALAIAYI